jgi:hypothetical protein
MSYRLSVIPRAIKDLNALEGKLFTQVTEAIHPWLKIHGRRHVSSCQTRRAATVCACGIFASCTAWTTAQKKSWCTGSSTAAKCIAD